jgi:hypothetical protein
MPAVQNAVIPVLEEEIEKVHINKPLSREEQESMVGSAFDDAEEEFLQARTKTAISVVPAVKPGFYLALDEDGEPTGSVLREPPEEGGFITVYPVSQGQPDVMTTASGAPITEHMNPETPFADPALEARNPVPYFEEDGEGNLRVVSAGDPVSATRETKTTVSRKTVPITSDSPAAKAPPKFEGPDAKQASEKTQAAGKVDHPVAREDKSTPKK